MQNELIDAPHRPGPSRITVLPAREASSPAKSKSGVHDRGLLLIALFKLVKSIFFFCVGLGAMHLINQDLGNVTMNLATTLHFDPEWKLVSLAVSKVDLINTHRLREIGVLSLAYSAIALLEGTGLLLEKTWAEYLTLGLTVAFLPWELFELAKDPGWPRFGLLLANLAVLWYLLWLLRRKRASA